MEPTTIAVNTGRENFCADDVVILLPRQESRVAAWNVEVW
jgi:hypothetical protein